MRISTNQYHQTSFDGIAKHQNELLKVQEQLTTGKRINNPSDDPVGMSQVIGLEKTVSQIGQYAKNGEYAKSQLNLEETQINSSVSVIQRARELTIQMMNGSYSPEDRKSVSQEIGELSKHLRNIMNSSNPEKELLFAGNNVNATAAFVPDANNPGAGYYSYIGNASAGSAHDAQANYGSRFVQISFDSNNKSTATDQGDPSRVRVTDNGAKVFEITGATTVYTGGVTGGTPLTNQPDANVFNVLKELQKYLANGEAPPASIGEDFDKSLNGLSKQLAVLGGRQNRIQSQYDAGQSFKVALDSRRTSIESTDTVAAISKFTQTQTALQMAQQVFTKVNQMSLFNYLK